MHLYDEKYEGKEGGVRFIRDQASNLGLASQTQSDALEYYHAISDEFTYGNWTERASSCLYLACRMNQEPVEPDEIAMGYSGIWMFRAVSKLKDELGVHGTAHIFTGEFIGEYCEQIGLGEEAVDNAYEIAEPFFNSPEGSGRTKRTISAAAVYLVAKLHNVEVTQTELCRVANVSQTTVKEVSDELIEFFEDDPSRLSFIGEIER